MKTCIKCGQQKADTEFPKSQHCATKVRGECKACRAEAGAALKRQRRAEERERARLEAEARKQVVNTNVAGPRNFVTTEVWVPTDRTFYRNNGLKHIQSRGV